MLVIVEAKPFPVLESYHSPSDTGNLMNLRRRKGIEYEFLIVQKLSSGERYMLNIIPLANDTYTKPSRYMKRINDYYNRLLGRRRVQM